MRDVRGVARFDRKLLRRPRQTRDVPLSLSAPRDRGAVGDLRARASPWTPPVAWVARRARAGGCVASSVARWWRSRCARCWRSSSRRDRLPRMRARVAAAPPASSVASSPRPSLNVSVHSPTRPTTRRARPGRASSRSVRNHRDRPRRIRRPRRRGSDDHVADPNLRLLLRFLLHLLLGGPRRARARRGGRLPLLPPARSSPSPSPTRTSARSR